MKTMSSSLLVEDVFRIGIATNQKQTQQQEEKHDNGYCSPLVTLPGYDQYPEKKCKG